MRKHTPHHGRKYVVAYSRKTKKGNFIETSIYAHNLRSATETFRNAKQLPDFYEGSIGLVIKDSE